VKTGGIAERFGQIVTKYVVRSTMNGGADALDATRLAHKLGLSSDSVSEVRKVMRGAAGTPGTTTIAKYFKVLCVSDEDQNYVLGIGLAQGMDFSELVEAIQISADFGQAPTNENQEIRDKKILARLAMRDGDLKKANALSIEIERFQSQLHLYAEKDLEQSAENLAKTLAFRGSIAFQALDFEEAYDQYSQIPRIKGLPVGILEKFSHSIRVSYNIHINALKKIDDARSIFNEMVASGISPNAFSYNTLLNFLKTESEVRAVFNEMLANGVPPDVVSYSTLLTFLKTETEARAVFDEMAANNVTPSTVSYSILMTKCENIERGKVVAREFKECFPDTACRELSSSFISLSDDFYCALNAAKYLRSEGHFVGRKEYDKVFSFPISSIPVQNLLQEFFNQEFHFDTSLENPINQYRNNNKPEQALQLLLISPYVGAAQKFYRQEYDLCKSYFDAELEGGNDEDNLHYAYGIAAVLNEDWDPARRHLEIALVRCFADAEKRRRHIRSLIVNIPGYSE
jgi:pentatricopeptide repeat protein